MAQTKGYVTDSPVSADLIPVLDQLACKAANNRKEEFADATGNWKQVEAYDVCLWWNGCYYCRSESGTWQQVKCYI